MRPRRVKSSAPRQPDAGRIPLGRIDDPAYTNKAEQIHAVDGIADGDSINPDLLWDRPADRIAGLA
jgi:hypothetical protein